MVKKLHVTTLFLDICQLERVKMGVCIRLCNQFVIQNELYQ